MRRLMDLPIEPLLSEISRTLRSERRLVLAAPPGAGKTTRVPLALAGVLAGFDPFPGKIIMLEPRRIAARMAAERMAATLGETVGERIGLSTRIDRRTSSKTLVEVVTDGLFTRRMLADPELGGVSAVIFDEIHERGLNADLGLALALEAQSALRDDLHLLAMSATLETEKMARTLNAPIIESQGRQYPVETRYLGRTRDRIEDQMARAIERAVRETKGSILAFLPGAGEIRRTAERLELPEDLLVAPLFGALSPKEQDAAVSPRADGGRKIVLATDIAESALTIEGVSVVVDSGFARVPKTDAQGLTQLETIRASRANVDQRRGRAGRLGPGICYRLWDAPETRGLTPAPTPEVLNADLSGLLLTLADWGERDAQRLTWLDPPPPGRLKVAKAQLQALGAFDENSRLTDVGRAMSTLPLPPRLAALIVRADTPGEKALAARMAVLISERGLGGASLDLNDRLTAFERDTSPRAKTLRRQAEHWGGAARPSGNAALVLAKGWPDAIARRRPGDQASFLLTSGRAGFVEDTQSLAKTNWLVVADMAGSASRARINLAAALTDVEARTAFQPRTREAAEFDPASKTVKARRVTSMGAITLDETPLPKVSGEAARDAIMAHIQTHGFSAVGLEDPVLIFLARLTALRESHGTAWPDWTLQGLQKSVRDWLAPSLETGSALPSAARLMDALKAKLDWPLPRDLDALAPLQFQLPSGRKAALDWLDEKAPLLEAKPQELYGLIRHPMIAESRIPITLALLSPAGRPVAVTRDLPGFWTGGYADMAKDMRGRYPKHDWPDDPANAKPHAGLTKARLAKG